MSMLTASSVREIGAETIKSIATSLEMKIVKEDAEGIDLLVPAYRVDVQRPCDVVEDILRIYGYNNVEIPTQLKSSLTVRVMRTRLITARTSWLSSW